jgi:hypothetical protein
MSATLRCDTIQNASSATANLTLDASGNATVGNTLVMGSSFKRNRIINGNMAIDQRNNGASLTITTGNEYCLDRYQGVVSVSSKFSVQQSTTAPVGFVNSLKATSLSAYTVGAAEQFSIRQHIEGLNISDLAWGTANAKTVTLSFQVYSSLTGTFGGALYNSNGSRSYPFSYSISSANTWTSISITIAGDTTGTWLTTNGVGITVNFGLGVGSSQSATAGTWAAGFYASATGATSVVGTNGATFYITGVQLEVGSVATPYERQIYSEQLAQCQRYAYKWIATGAAYAGIVNATTISATEIDGVFRFPVSMRTNPTASFSAVTTFYADNGTALTGGSISLIDTTPDTGVIRISSLSGLTVNQARKIRANNDATAYMLVSAEL